MRLVRANAPNGELVFGRDRLPVGDYRIELYCPGLGRIDVGFVRIDGTTRTTLRGVTLPAPARVSFPMDASRAEPAKGTFALVRRGVAVDHRLATKQSFEGPHLLGAGEYVLFWRDRENVNQHAFTIDAAAAGSDVTIDVP